MQNFIQQLQGLKSDYNVKLKTELFLCSELFRIKQN